MKCPQFRLFDFEIINKVDEYDSEYYEGDRRRFIIKIFAMDEKGLTYCIFAKGFQPFFYIKVYDSWKKSSLDGLNSYINKFLAKDTRENYLGSKLIKRHDFVGFFFFEFSVLVVVFRKSFFSIFPNMRYIPSNHK